MTTIDDNQIPDTDLQLANELTQQYAILRQNLEKQIVGLDQTIEQVFIAILCQGHCIIEGVPGLAKTLLISTIANMLGLSFKRIQFTPDLMPADITGTDILEQDHATGQKSFRFAKGPVFANIILADEINRTPPKTQSALLEAMAEKQITAAGNTHQLPQPFFVLATQNPIEQEGTYPLPEAQLDRFMFKIKVAYPTIEQEIKIAKIASTDQASKPTEIISAQLIENMQTLVRKVVVAEHVYEYAVKLARLTRPDDQQQNSLIDEMVSWGAGPRASIFLLLAAKGHALLQGRYHATTQDVAAIALPVLRHRIILSFQGESAGLTTDDLIEQLLAALNN